MLYIGILLCNVPYLAVTVSVLLWHIARAIDLYRERTALKSYAEIIKNL